MKRAQESRHSYHARVAFVRCMQQGYFWQLAAEVAGISISQSTAYRLCQIVRERGEEALQDKRQGHPSKLRGDARVFLEAFCREIPCMPSSTLQVALRERFDLQVSVSQINRVRAALGVSNHFKQSQQEKKTGDVGASSSQPEWFIGAGSLLSTFCYPGNKTDFLPGDGTHFEPLHR